MLRKTFSVFVEQKVSVINEEKDINRYKKLKPVIT